MYLFPTVARDIWREKSFHWLEVWHQAGNFHSLHNSSRWKVDPRVSKAGFHAQLSWVGILQSQPMEEKVWSRLGGNLGNNPLIHCKKWGHKFVQNPFSDKENLGSWFDWPLEVQHLGENERNKWEEVSGHSVQNSPILVECQTQSEGFVFAME